MPQKTKQKNQDKIILRYSLLHGTVCLAWLTHTFLSTLNTQKKSESQKKWKMRERGKTTKKFRSKQYIYQFFCDSDFFCVFSVDRNVCVSHAKHTIPCKTE